MTADRHFSLETKSLHLSRRLIGLCLLIDLFIRSRALEAHYSDDGVLPRDAFSLSQWDWAWSLHTLSGSVAFEGVLFGLTAVALLAFTLLPNARWPAVASLALILSMHARNPLLRDGQDDLARVLLFFYALVPPTWAAKVRGPGTVGLTLQVCVLYWASLLHKLVSPWWTDLGALSHVLSMRRYQTGLAQQLVGFTGALSVVTAASMALELLGPLLLLVGWNRPRIRIGVIAAMCGLHLGMAAMLRLGAFPYLCVAMWLAFLPGPPEGHVEQRAAPKWEWGVAFAAITLVVLLNVQNLTHVALPAPLNVVARAIGLQQWWGVFAPTKDEPYVADGWYWAQGRTQTAQLVTVDVPYFSSSDTPPAQLVFASSRWRHLLANLSVVGWPPHSAQARTQQRSRDALTAWLCEDWNNEHPEQRLTHLYLFWFRHEVGHVAPVDRVLLGEASCNGSG